VGMQLQHPLHDKHMLLISVQDQQLVGMQLQHPLHDKHMLLIPVQGWQACWNAAAASPVRQAHA